MSAPRPTSQHQIAFPEQMFDLTNTEERDTMGGVGREEAERSDNHAKIELEVRLEAFQAMVGQTEAFLAREWARKTWGTSQVCQGSFEGVWIQIIFVAEA